MSAERVADTLNHSPFLPQHERLDFRRVGASDDGNHRSPPMSHHILSQDDWSRHKTNRNLSANPSSSANKRTEGARPFSISIQGKSFYGGLTTYSHEFHPARFCRVMNACVRNDYTLVLPQWMQRHDNILKFQCGYPNIEFSQPDNEAPPPLKNLDLVGIHSSRPSMPDFLVDFVSSAVIFDLVYGDRQVSKSCHSRKGKGCESFPSLSENFNPAVILHQRLKSLEYKKSWVRQFVSFMKPPHSGKDAQIIYEDSFTAGSADMSCFRSVFFTRGPFNRNLIMEDHLRNIHFLNRETTQRKARSVPSLQGPEMSPQVCSLNVTITNRKRIDGAYNRLIGRYIRNIPLLKEAILERAKKVPGLDLNVASLTLEGKSLRWQIGAIQKTDIWVAGHGPLLTNMIFLREKSSVIELQPFAFYPRTYENMAELLAHVSYERYIADPDVEGFKTCIDQVYNEEHPDKTEASKILDRYMRASKKYFASDSTHTLVLHSLKEDNLHAVKQCALMQRLLVNVNNFAIAVVRHARVRCGLPKPGQ